MAITKQYTRHMLDSGYRESVQALTQASTATTILNYGVTTITSAGSGTAGDHGFKLQAPQKGLRKTIVADLNSTRTVSVFNASTACTFFGSTNNAVTFSTGTGLKWVNLVGVSTASWAITGVSTGATLSASTVGA